MKSLSCCLSTLVLLAVASVAHADAKSDAATRAKAMAPFVEAGTVAVIHIDLTRVDPVSGLNMLARFVPMPPGELARARENGTKELQGFIRGGVKEHYVVVTMGEAGWQPKVVVVVPVPTGTDEASLRATLHVPTGIGQIMHGWFVFSPGPEKKQLGEFHPVERPELLAAFEAAGDAAVQVALIPPAYAARVVDDLLPEFPKEIGGGPTTVLTRGVCWMAAGIDLPPHPSVHLTIKAADAKAAEALRDKLADIAKMVGRYEQVRKLVPKFDEVAATLLPKADGDRLLLDLSEQNQGVAKLLSLLAPPVESLRANAAKMQSMNNLKQIALAMHNYAANHKAFPPPYSTDKNGKPLLSWRVLILQYLEGDTLFRQFHLDEPWDSPHNRTLIAKMPSVYRLQLSKTEAGRTNYLLPVGGGAAFEDGKPTRFQDIQDGTSNTVMVVEADDEYAVIWTKPEDLSFDPKDPTKGLGRFFNGSFNAAICDGSVRWFAWPSDAKSIARLRALFTRAGREVIEWGHE